MYVGFQEILRLTHTALHAFLIVLPTFW